MKILEINKFHYVRRGAERHLFDVIALLKKNGHEVAVFSMEHPENIPSSFERFFPRFVGYSRGEATLWQRIKGTFRIFWSCEARKKITLLLKEFHPDVVHIHNMYHQLSPSILGPLKRLHIPIVMTVHDYNLISPDKDVYYEAVGKHYFKFLFIRKYSFFKRALLVKKMYWERIMGFYKKNIDLYIVPSAFVKDVFLRAGFPEEKMVVIPHFILGEPHVLEERDATSKPYALYFGSVSEGKGVSDLVAIFDTLKLPLIVAGMREGDFHPTSSTYVTFVGQKSREELAELVRRSICVVSASQLPETFGLIALEASTYGKPFFGFATGALGEIIENGKNGYLAKNKEAFQKYIADFFLGSMHFDAQEIQREAYARFGEARYRETFETLIQRLEEEKKKN